MHLIENNFASLYKQALEKCFWSKNNLVHNTTFSNINPLNNLYINNAKNIDMKKLSGILYWHISKSNNLAGLIEYQKFCEFASNDYLTLNSAYGYELFKKASSDNITGWNFCLKELKNSKNTKKAIFFLNKIEFLNPTNRDLPNILSGQFYISNDKLCLTINSSSTDLIDKFISDFVLFSVIQQVMLINLLDIYPELELGELTYTSCVTFILEKDLDLVEQMLLNQFESFRLPYLYNDFITKSLDDISNDPLIKYILETK